MTETEQLRSRLLGRRPTDVLWGWIGPLVITVIGGVLRFWDLRNPTTLNFDETYYVKQAHSLLQFGIERQPDKARFADDTAYNAAWNAGNPMIWGTEADYVVHPPVGKWVIAFGEWIFGANNSFGWRFSVALLGTLSILMVARAARRMFGSTLLGCIAGLLLAFDGHHFVHSRTGLLDLIVMFFALCAFCALLIDRDQSREKLATLVGKMREDGVPFTDRRWIWGPWLGLRPWRWVAAVSLGLCIGTKWSGIFFLAAFGLMTVFWDMGARRLAGIKRWFVSTFVTDAPQAALTMVTVAVATYIASWAGWFRSTDGYLRNWGAENAASGAAAMVPDALRALWKYHTDAYGFHVTLNSPHTYQSNPWSWLLMSRPTSFYYEGPKNGQEGCTVEQCSKAITSLGTPILWWSCIAAMAVLFFMWIIRRDWRAGAILAGFAGGYFPWLMYQNRTIFTFYAVAFVPFVALAVAYCLGLILGKEDASPARHRVGYSIVGLYVVAVMSMFLFFWPILSAQVIPLEQWQMRMWFKSWI